MDRVNVLLEQYNLIVNDIVHINVEFIPVKPSFIFDYDIPCQKEDYTSIQENKDTSVENVSNVTVEHDKKLDILTDIPVTTNLDSILPLVKLDVQDGLITNIPIEFKGKTINLLDNIKHQNKILALKKTGSEDTIDHFDHKWKLFYLESGKLPSVLALKFYSDCTVTNIRYSLNGVIITRVVDKVTDCNTVMRYNNNYIKPIVDTVVTNIKYNMNLIPIKFKILLIPSLCKVIT